MKGVLRKNESAWEFELNASYRYFNYRKSKNYRFYMNEDPFKFLKGGIINKGEIRETAKTFLEQKSINFTWEKQKVGVSTKETPI